MKRVHVTAVCLCLAITVGWSQTTFANRLSQAAIELTHDNVSYDPAYFSITYPGGDVPADKGVCTDVIIRAYRKLGVDLQKKVHEHMLKNFKSYPRLWGLKKTDTNIDHRRVPNLMFFFEKNGISKVITNNPDDYDPGDIVAWSLGKNVTHIGLVIDQKSEDGNRNLIVHNIGNGQEISDCLFDFKIIGHYTYQK